MGKKGKRGSYKKFIGSFVMKNRVMLAAVVGAATGITLANVLGTEKAKRVIGEVGDSVKDFIKNPRIDKLEETRYSG
jgi:hypothetical protein